MNMKITACRAASLGALTLVAIAMFAPGVALAVDATAAQALARQNNCFKCHAVDKKKEGPAWKEVAAKLKSDKDAEAKLYTHLTTGPKVKFEDGHQEDHPIIKAKTPEDTKNLVQWILSLQ
jgi:cytochrome c